MFRSHGRPPRVLCHLTLLFALLLLSATALAQTAAAPQNDAARDATATAARTADATPAPSPAPSPEAAAPPAAPAPTVAATTEVKGEAKEAAKPETAAATAPVNEAAAAASPSPTPSPAPAAAAQGQGNCKRFIDADVIALAQPYMLNRLGAVMPHGVVYALSHDVTPPPADYATNVTLQPWKRARPIVLRANQGDCLRVQLTNLIDPNAGGSSTGPVSLHAQGMQLVNSIADDGSFVGVNDSSLVDPLKSKPYMLFTQQEGTFLLYSEGDTNTMGQQLQHGLFGAVNVQPEGAEWYRSQVTEADLELAIDRSKGNNGRTPLGQPIIKYDARYPANYKDAARRCAPILQMAAAEQVVVNGTCQPKPLPPGTPPPTKPTLKLYHTDLTAIITGPGAGRFPGTTGVGVAEPPCDRDGQPVAGVNPLFCTNPTLPDRKQPYREITVIYHEVTVAVQAFPIFKSGSVQDPANPNDPTKTIPNPAQFTVEAGQDLFAINYGTGGIGAEIYANRIGVGPMASCVDCKFEEFFLTSWAVGDPAMVVDTPANYVAPTPPAPACNPGTLKAAGQPNNCLVEATKPLVTTIPTPPPPQRKATMAFYPDDPSNVYHTYLNDHVKFRILHGGTGVTHVHHQHAHQWLQTPASSDASYLDSQFISPGASYSLEMVYGGSGNRNKTVGDSIFHCHFYPHFAAGMWSMWRVHDVFEEGTVLDPTTGKPARGARALPDWEIVAGTPIPAIVPLPTLPMPLMPSDVYIDNGQIAFGKPCPPADSNCKPDTTGQGVTANPGYPFFIPGVAGSRPPHPPLDFAPVLNAQGNPVPGQFLDGGLPRHVNLGGEAEHQLVFTTDVNNWSKDFKTLDARQLPEDGTNVEKVAIAFNNTRCRPSFLPDGSQTETPGMPEAGCAGTRAQFVLNGLPRGPQQGSPFADPAIDDTGLAVGAMKRYKAAVFQMDLDFNKQRWHFGQQRLLALWRDVTDTIDKKRPAEPLFFRANSEEHFIEYWHTNLVPNYYDRDAFQVRTPTDIIGQHIHNVKFDVTSSDGAANGYNYEDGTLGPAEVQDVINAINAAGGIVRPDGTRQPLGQPKAPPKEIFDCAANPNDVRCKPCPPPSAGGPACLSWLGAQTTVQRWYADPFRSNPGTTSGARTGSEPPRGVDNTMRTVFTHDHFGPSTHQQAGLYAGLVLEPKGSKWLANDSNQPLGPAPNAGRTDGGPTSWQARILTAKPEDSYREFVLEFQDLTLAYFPQPDNTAVNPPGGPKTPGQPTTPTLISTGGQPAPGTQTVNYYNEPLPFRVSGLCDIAYAYTSTCQVQGGVASPGSPLPVSGDPRTPLMRAYENDKVQVRTLVGAHTFSHFFTMAGPRWFFEPSWNNSGYRNSQGMGISEHFEMLFTVPPSSMSQSNRKCPDGSGSNGNCVDYLYSPSDDNFGLTNGMWGLLRAYDPRKPLADVKPLPAQSNPIVPGKTLDPFQPCPANLRPDQRRKYNVSAVVAKTALPGGAITFNSRGTNTGGEIIKLGGMMYVFTEDLEPGTRKLKPNVPVEPLILRANAGDCIEVTLTNELDTNSKPFTDPVRWPTPFQTPLKTSPYVGLHPQLLSYDGATDGGFNIGYNNRPQSVPARRFATDPAPQITYRWYAGTIDRNPNGSLKHTPVEFGSLNLLPADPISHHVWGLYGAMVVEPAGSSWRCEADDPADPTKKIQVGCDPTAPGYNPAAWKNYTRAAATVTAPSGAFREFVAMVSEDLNFGQESINRSAVNYRVEPTYFRFGNANETKFAADGNNSCALANLLVGGDPQTPVFTATAGTPFRFRLLHPQGTGTAQVFVLNGHVWQREPYTNKSTVIGDNPLSQWMGSHDSYGGTDHFDLVAAKAGGANEVPGDYLYTTFVPNQNFYGSWGVFRVLDKNGNQVSGSQPAGPQKCPSVPGTRQGYGNPTQIFRRFVRQPFGTR